MRRRRVRRVRGWQRYYSYRTEETYLQWIRRFIVSVPAGAVHASPEQPK